MIGVQQITEQDDVMLITDKGKIIRLRGSDISVIGRNTQGVKLIELEPEKKSWLWRAWRKRMKNRGAPRGGGALKRPPRKTRRRKRLKNHEAQGIPQGRPTPFFPGGKADLS